MTLSASDAFSLEVLEPQRRQSKHHLSPSAYVINPHCKNKEVSNTWVLACYIYNKSEHLSWRDGSGLMMLAAKLNDLI